MAGPDTLLEIAGLNVTFATEGGPLQAVRDVGFTLGRERLAIVGESGSGKSTVARALLGLLPSRAQVSARLARFHGPNGSQDLLGLAPRAQRALRGRQIGMIVQDPRQGLNPVQRLGDQLAEMLRLHDPALSRRAAHSAATALLAEVDIQDPERVARGYVHQISGGMAQRVMIAMMLAARPRILIADEATSALDRLVQLRILDLIEARVTERGMGLLLISHDLDLVARYADRILVMYRGRIVEDITTAGGLDKARHPYTRGLLACRPHPGTVGQLLPTLERDPAWLT